MSNAALPDNSSRIIRPVRDWDVQRMVRDERWKLLWYPKAERYQLFDLSKDPWEIDDLSGKADHAATLERMKKRLAEEQKRWDDQLK